MAPSTQDQPPRLDSGVEANARLTALAAVALLGLLAAEGVTVLRIHQLLPAHLFVGLMLVPPVVLKMSSSGYRFIRYYAGDPRYRAAGRPNPLLQLIAPVVVLSTMALFATGIELWLFGLRFGATWLTWHKLSFVAWFFATGAHVLGHLERAPRLALADLDSRAAVPGAVTRRALLGASLLLGVLIALVSLAWQTPFAPLAGG